MINGMAGYIVFGILIITCIDTLGAVASRKWNFNYRYLGFFSFALYISVALGMMLVAAVLGVIGYGLFAVL